MLGLLYISNEQHELGTLQCISNKGNISKLDKKGHDSLYVYNMEG